MSDSTQQYILKQPIAIDVEKVFNGQVYELPFRQWGMKNGHACISEETFDELFQLLDIPAIEKQLDEIIWRNAFTTFIDSDSDEQQAEIDKAVGDILGLFGLENKETE